MRRWIGSLLLSAVLLGVNGCVPTSDIEVDRMSSGKANMQGYRTYQFIEESGVIEDDGSGKLRASDKKIAAMIEEVINEELQKRGKTPVAKDPDFFVAYVGGTNMEAVHSKLDEHGKKSIEEVKEAALLIMLIDAETGAIIRLSTAEGEMKHLPLDKQRESIDYAVGKMLKDI